MIRSYEFLVLAMCALHWLQARAGAEETGRSRATLSYHEKLEFDDIAADTTGSVIGQTD